MILEVCANSFESAKIAQESGAHRIELCVDLSVGGLTPPRSLIEKVTTQLSIETQVLIRPRAGNFVYSKKELTQMIEDIKFCQEIGCAGVVSGALTAKDTLEVEMTKQLIHAAVGMEFTFHRAFDLVDNPWITLDQLIQLGVTRLLSSGQAPKASLGISLLSDILEKSEGKIQIMPGSGITSHNALIFINAGFQMIHFSAIQKSNSSKSQDLFRSDVIGFSDGDEIQKIKQITQG